MICKFEVQFCKCTSNNKIFKKKKLYEKMNDQKKSRFIEKKKQLQLSVFTRSSSHREMNMENVVVHTFWTADWI